MRRRHGAPSLLIILESGLQNTPLKVDPPRQLIAAPCAQELDHVPALCGVLGEFATTYVGTEASLLHMRAEFSTALLWTLVCLRQRIVRWFPQRCREPSFYRAKGSQRCVNVVQAHDRPQALGAQGATR